MEYVYLIIQKVFWSKPSYSIAIIVNNGFYSTNNNGSTVGADASVEALKVYDMKLLTLAYLALSRSRSPLNLHCEKSEK